MYTTPVAIYTSLALQLLTWFISITLLISLMYIVSNGFRKTNVKLTSNDFKYHCITGKDNYDYCIPVFLFRHKMASILVARKRK